MNFNEVFCNYLRCADRYQELLEDEDKCLILKQKGAFMRRASLAQKKELDGAFQILIVKYGLYEMSKPALQRSYDTLNNELECVREEFCVRFSEFREAVVKEFGNLPVDSVWPEDFINSKGLPELEKYHVSMVGFGVEEMKTRRAFYCLMLENSAESVTPLELEMSYRVSKSERDFSLPIEIPD